VGKTHLAVGLGLKAIEQGYRVLFTTAAALLTTLTRALSEGRLEEKLKVYTVPRLLIIDEIGYLPIDRTGANLVFQLISRRNERGPMILTSNQSFGAWGDVFGDRVIATAILDRVLDHAITINIRGNSYRLKEKLSRAGPGRGGPRIMNRGGDFSMTAPGEDSVTLDTRSASRPRRPAERPPVGAGICLFIKCGGLGVLAHQVQRCQWHKRENVLSYLPERAKLEWRRQLQRAYAEPTYERAKAALGRCARELRLLNASAAASLLEGLEETLTLHRLGVPEPLRVSLRTTNPLESIMARVEDRTAKVDH
jgi:hypothetical protein